MKKAIVIIECLRCVKFILYFGKTLQIGEPHNNANTADAKSRAADQRRWANEKYLCEWGHYVGPFIMLRDFALHIPLTPPSKLKMIPRQIPPFRGRTSRTICCER